MAGKVLGRDAGAWFSQEFTEQSDPKSISHETTFPEDTLDAVLVNATIAKLTQLVGRRLREHSLWSKTVQIKIRYSDFSTQTRAKTLEEATQLDSVLLQTVRGLYERNYVRGKAVRLLGVYAGTLQKAAWKASRSLFDNRRQDQVGQGIASRGLVARPLRRIVGRTGSNAAPRAQGTSAREPFRIGWAC